MKLKIWSSMISFSRVAPWLVEVLRRSAEPIGVPCGGIEGIGKVLCLVHDLAIAELHDADRVCRARLIGDGVLGDPEVALPEHSPDAEAGGLAGVVASQGLQIASSEDAFARLRIVADGIVGVDNVLRVCVAGCRCVPVGVQGLAYLVLFGRLLWDVFDWHVELPHGMEPGPKV